MSITVIGFFNDRAHARDAVEQLTRSGFNDGDIDVSHNSTEVSSSDDGQILTDVESGNNTNTVHFNKNEHRDNEGNAITRFFNSLFGSDSDNANRYSAMSQKATSIVTVHAAGTEQAEEAANILDASGAMDIDEGELTDYTHDDVVAGSADQSLHQREGIERVSTEVSGRSTQHYSNRVHDHTVPVTSQYTEPVDTEMMSEGLTEADLEEAGIDPADIVTAENAASHFEIENETAPGGIAPGITGAPVSGNITTAQEHYGSVNTEHDNRYSQNQNSANRGRSRIIRGRVEDEHRLRTDHTTVNRRNVDRLPD